MAIDFDYANNPTPNSNGFISVDVSDAVSGLYRYANFTRYKAKQVCKEYAEEIQDYMQKNAPWKDRSEKEHNLRAPNQPHARDSMHAEYFEKQGLGKDQLDVGVELSYGVTYGIFLEYNGLRTPKYEKRRRPIIVNEYQGVVPAMKARITLEFFEKLTAQLMKIAKV